MVGVGGGQQEKATMAGLRERQKRMRKEAILRAALELFDRVGFANTTIEAVAERAGLSVPTLYRYVKSKGELLLELQRVNVSRLAAQAQHVLDAPPDDPVEALAALFEAQNSDMFDCKPGTKELDLWRMVVSEAIRSPEPLGRNYFSGDAVLVRQIEQLCDILKSRGSLHPMADSRVLAQLLSFTARGFFRMRLLGTRISNREIRQAFAAYVRTIYDGIRPVSTLDDITKVD
jgi:AcrR family transcriptional regulator